MEGASAEVNDVLSASKRVPTTAPVFAGESLRGSTQTTSKRYCNSVVLVLTFVYVSRSKRFIFRLSASPAAATERPRGDCTWKRSFRRSDWMTPSTPLSASFPLLNYRGTDTLYVWCATSFSCGREGH